MLGLGLTWNIVTASPYEFDTELWTRSPSMKNYHSCDPDDRISLQEIKSWWNPCWRAETGRYVESETSTVAGELLHPWNCSPGAHGIVYLTS
jgi:hypothetical protein